MPACLRCRTLVDTKVLLHVLCCSVQGRLKAVLLCLRYVDTLAFGAWIVPSWCSEEEKQVQKQTLRCFEGHMASRADGTGSFLSNKSTSPAVMFTSRLVLPSAMSFFALSRAPVSRTCHNYTNTRALPAACCYGVVAALRLVLVLLLQLPITLSHHEKTKEKRTSQEPKK